MGKEQLLTYLRCLSTDIGVMRGDLLFNEYALPMDENPEAAQFFLLALSNLEQASGYMRLAAIKLEAANGKEEKQNG